MAISLAPLDFKIAHIPPVAIQTLISKSGQGLDFTTNIS
jgi:hypothetical protein